MTPAVSYLQFRKALCVGVDLSTNRGLPELLVTDQTLADQLKTGGGDANFLKPVISEILQDQNISELDLGDWNLRIASVTGTTDDLHISQDAVYLPWPLPLELAQGGKLDENDQRIKDLLARLAQLNITPPALPTGKVVGLIESWEKFVLNEGHEYNQSPGCNPGDTKCETFYENPLDPGRSFPHHLFCECRIATNLPEDYLLSWGTDLGSGTTDGFVFWLPKETRKKVLIPWGPDLKREEAPISSVPFLPVSLLSCTAKCDNFWSSMQGK